MDVCTCAVPSPSRVLVAMKIGSTRCGLTVRVCACTAYLS
jgi:hypothetical protein